MTDELLTTTEVARRLGISPSGVREASRKAGLQRYVAGRRVYSAEDVERLQQRSARGRPFKAVLPDDETTTCPKCGQPKPAIEVTNGRCNGCWLDETKQALRPTPPVQSDGISYDGEPEVRRDGDPAEADRR